MKMLTLLGIFIFSISALAMNGRTTYQAKIIKPDGYPLEATNVNFKFSVLDTVGSCVLYSETYSAINMTATGGLISFALGGGARAFPPASATTAIFSNVFDNSITSMPCEASGIYNPLPTDTRRIVMQFNDGNGWQTLPAMTINAVPYAMYANKSNDSKTLNGKADTAFVENSTLAALNCNPATHAITFNGVSFSCIPVGSSSSGITSVTTSGTVLVIGGTASAPVISIKAVTMSQDGYLTSLDYAEFKAKLAASSTQIINTLGYAPVSGAAVTTQINNSNLSGDVSGTISSNSVVSVGGKTSAQISTSVNDTLAATSSATADTIVKRNSSGNTTFNDIYANAAKINYVDIYKPSTSFNIRLQAPTSLSTNYILNLPTTSGTTGQVLSTDGSGNLSWINPSTGSVVSVSATAPLASTGGSNPTISITQATSSTAGYLSSADWNTFNNKQVATSAAIIATLGYTPADNAASGTYAQKANNLSDLTSSATARTNLGLGTLATANSIDLGSASATGIIADARLATQSNVTSGTQYTKVTVDGKGRVTSGAQLSSSDVTTALGYTPANDAASGTYLVKASNLSDLTNIPQARTNLGLGGFATVSSLDLGTASATGTLAVGRLPSFVGDATIAAASNTIVLSNSGVTAGTYTKVTVDAKGRVTSSSALSSSDVTTALGYTPANSTSGVTSLNGSASQTQTFTSSNAGTAFGISTSNGVHTFAIPLASSSSVTAGLLSNADYTTFTNKQNATSSAIIATLGYTPANATSATQWTTNGSNIYYNTGNIGVGIVNPSAKLELASGTASVAPLKFTSGTLLTSAQSGSMEYDGFNFYLTDSTNTRRTIATGSSAGTIDNASNINSSGNITMTPVGSVIVSSTTASTNSNTGALVVKGGLGVAGNINTAGNLNVSGSSVIDGSLKLSSMTSGSVLFAGANGTVTQDNSSFYWDGANKRLGIGGNSPAQTLSVSGSSYFSGNVGIGTTNPTDSLVIVDSSGADSVAANGGLLVKQGGTAGLGASIVLDATADLGKRYSLIATGNGASAPDGSFAIFDSSASAYRFTVDPNGSVGIGTTAAGTINGVVDSATKLNLVGGAELKHASSPRLILTDTSAPLDKKIYEILSLGTDFYINRMNDTAATRTNYLIIKDGGNVGIGITTPTAKLHLSAGTSATAALKITSGSLLAIPSDGAIEYDGTSLYYTDSTNTRRALTSNSGNQINSANNTFTGTNTFTGSTYVSNNTASINSTTGALVVSGGVGVGGAINVAGDAYVSGALTVTGIIQSISDIVAGGVIKASSGTATQPSYTFTTDAATGVWQPASGAIALSTAGSEKIRVTSSGRVGIGTTTPAYYLDIDVKTADMRIKNTGTAGYPVQFMDSYSDFATWAGSALVMRRARGTEASPTYVNSGDSLGYIAFRDHLGGGGALIGTMATEAHSATAKGTALIFQTNANTIVASTEKMRIDHNGNVGIGTTTPGYKLDISGDVNVSGASKYRINGYEIASALPLLNNYFFAGSGNLSITGTNNSAVGFQALSANSSGYDNTALGYRAAYSNTTGFHNTAAGAAALYANTTGNYNTAFGGAVNSLQWYPALRFNTTGSHNAAFGLGALAQNTTGSNNTALGTAAMYSANGNSSGSNNTATGYGSLYSIETGTNNTANGYNSLFNLSVGSNNVAIGATTGGGITTGSNNTIIGRNISALPTGLSNAVLIGANFGDNTISSGSVVIADGAGNRRINVDSNGNVGIGTTNPSHVIDVVDNGNDALFKITEFSNTYPADIRVFRARGTQAGPAALQSGDVIGGFNFYGYGAATAPLQRSAAIEAIASENFTTTARGADLSFRVAASGTTAAVEAMRITQEGRVGIGVSSPAEKLSVNGVVQSLSGGFRFPDGTIQNTAQGNYYPTGTTAADPIIKVDELYGKPAGTYYVKWLDGSVKQNYWDGMWLTVHDEGINANLYTAFWSDTYVTQMTTFGGIANAYGHGWNLAGTASYGSANSANTNTLTITNLPRHREARYQVRWHFVDSIDSEANELRIYDFEDYNAPTVFWSATKPYSGAPSMSNFWLSKSSWTGASYSFAPWTGSSVDGYVSIDTRHFSHNTSQFKAMHFTAVDQGRDDEAVYFSHSVLKIR